MNLNWNINTLESYTNYQGKTDVVYRVYWQIIATQEANGKTYTVYNNDITRLTIGDLESFTPFESLTKDQVVGWITNTINYPALTASLQTQLDQQINPTSVQLLPPWN